MKPDSVYEHDAKIIFRENNLTERPVRSGVANSAARRPQRQSSPRQDAPLRPARMKLNYFP